MATMPHCRVRLRVAVRGVMGMRLVAAYVAIGMLGSIAWGLVYLAVSRALGW